MDATYSRAVGLAIPVFFALIALEFAVDLVRGTRYYRLADALNSLSCGIISTGMRVFFAFLGLFAYEWALNHAAPIHLGANQWTTWVFAFVLYDFCYYWQHRFGHTVGLFWASHVVHHQSEEFNLTTALRQPGTGALLNWIFYVPMALAGVPIGVFLMVGVAQLFYQFWPHTRHIGRLGFLDRWIQTPSNHRVHHAQNDMYLDKNYVGVFLIWDHWFGSFQEERDDEPPIYGIRGQLKSWNPVWANLHYYWAMARDCRHARSWGDKLRVWFAPPGWRPADVAARFPKPEYDPRRDFAQFDPPRSVAMSAYALCETAALIAADYHFLAVLPKQAAWLNVLYFLFILSGLVTLGGILENRREFVWLEAGRMAVTGAALLALGSWFGGVRDPRVVLSLESFVLLSGTGLLACFYLAQMAPAARARGRLETQ
ncbi:MAG TPA: sterol desaturase family protein [Bryobacteraceae bacterium]|nr:sterol desaturase family protein [Bryobacteraceae bacterium]